MVTTKQIKAALRDLGMRTLPCTQAQCRELQRRVNGTFYLYPDWNDNQKTDDVFIGYGGEIEMYEPGEYEEVAE